MNILLENKTVKKFVKKKILEFWSLNGSLIPKWVILFDMLDGIAPGLSIALT